MNNAKVTRKIYDPNRKTWQGRVKHGRGTMCSE